MNLDTIKGVNRQIVEKAADMYATAALEILDAHGYTIDSAYDFAHLIRRIDYCGILSDVIPSRKLWMKQYMRLDMATVAMLRDAVQYIGKNKVIARLAERKYSA